MADVIVKVIEGRAVVQVAGVPGDLLAQVTSAATLASSARDEAVAAAAVVAGSGVVRVRAVSTAPVVLSPAPSNIGGSAASDGDLFLLASQPTPAENGPYVLVGGVLQRPVGFEIGDLMSAGQRFFAVAGDYEGSTIYLTGAESVIIGTDPLRFAKDGSPVPVFERVILIGDSITESSDFPTTNWATQIGARLGLTPENLGEGGDEVADRAGAIMSHDRYDGDLITIKLGDNDVHFSDANDQGNRWIIDHGLLAMTLHAAVPSDFPSLVTADDMAVGSGAWLELSSSYDPSGRYSSTAGATLIAPVLSARSIALLGWWNDGLSGDFRVEIGTEVYGPFSVTPSIVSGGGSVQTDDGETFMPFAMIFDGLALGDHEVRIIQTSGTICISKVIGLSGDLVEGPVVAVGNMYRRKDNGPDTGWNQGGSTGGEARAALFNRFIDENVRICQRLGLSRVLKWDVSAAIDPDIHLKPDGLHPIQAGQDALAQSLLALLQQSMIRPDEKRGTDLARSAAIPLAGYKPREGTVLVREAFRWVGKDATEALGGGAGSYTPTHLLGSGSITLSSATGRYVKTSQGVVHAVSDTMITGASSPSGGFYLELAPAAVGLPVFGTVSVRVDGLEAALGTKPVQAAVIEVSGKVYAWFSVIDGGAAADFGPYLKNGGRITVTATYLIS